MPEAFSTCSLLFAALLFSFCTFVSEAEVVCWSNDCDGCCVTSEFCSTEHTLIGEKDECRMRSPSPSPETPLVSDLQLCPFDLYTGKHEPCPNSRVNVRSQSVGEYGKPDWVGAEFQSISHDSFSMTVMWQHIIDTDIQLPPLNLTAVQGYEVRIYKRKKREESVLHCFCVEDPSMRNITDIRSNIFTYEDMLNMIVEVRTYPSLNGQDEDNRRRNCSLLTGCASTNAEAEYCTFSHDCYSWPQNCFNFFDPLTCAPQLYGPPVIVKAEMSLVDDNVTDGDAWKIDLSWEPPMMNDLLPIPKIYYVTIEGSYSTLNFEVNTTNVSILPLNYTMYTVFIGAYVPCSGWSRPTQIVKDSGDIGCGYQANTTIFPPTPTPTITVLPTSSVLPTTAGPTERTSQTPINIIIATAIAVALSAAVIIICIFATLIILQRKYAHKSKSSMPTLYVDIDIGLQPKLNTNVSVFVFYPKNTEHEDEVFIQTYIVSELSRYTEIKEIKSCDDPYFERGHIPESIDKRFREADFVIIVCNSLLLSEWNCDECSPSVQLLKRYMGSISIRSDDSSSKLITVILDEQKKQLLHHSRLNLGSLRSFMVTESTWENDIQNIIRYMTGTPLFQITTQQHSLDVLDTLESPGTPVSDIVPDSSQESHAVTPRTSDSSLYDHDIVCTQGSEEV